jgi:hypothetical protein
MPSCTDQPFIDKAEKELIGSGYFGLSDRDKEEIIRLAEAFTAAAETETAKDSGK